MLARLALSARRGRRVIARPLSASSSSPPPPEPQPYARSRAIPLAMQHAIASGAISEDTPVAMFIDLDRLRSKAAAMHAAFPPTVDITHAFAVKANPLAGVLHEVQAMGGGAECASMFEVEHALRQGVPPAKIIFDSPCKTRPELLRCFELGVVINLDCMEEIERVARILEAEVEALIYYPEDIDEDDLIDALEAVLNPMHIEGGGAKIGVRVNPQIGAGSIAAVSTATATSKFGVGLVDYEADLIAAFERYDWLTGLHCHVGSQGCELSLLVEGVRRLSKLAEDINGSVGRAQVSWLDLGGGLPMNYGTDEERPTYEEYAAALLEAVPEVRSSYIQHASCVVSPSRCVGTTPRLSLVCLVRFAGPLLWLRCVGPLLSATSFSSSLIHTHTHTHTPSPPDQVFEEGRYKLYTEFGRSLVTKAGWLGTRIEYTKVAGGQHIATCHVGSNMLLRTAYFPETWRHEMTVLDALGGVKPLPGETGAEAEAAADHVEEELIPYNIAGPLCFSGDQIALRRPLPRIAAGDHLVIHDCGG